MVAICLLLGNVFCERFYFHGIRTILTLYLSIQLRFMDQRAVTIYHCYLGIAYIMPVIGAIISDGWLGKFRTIMYVYILYIFGNIIIVVGSIPSPLIIMTAVSLIGLVVISTGAGCVKPCLTAFGGDQFPNNQEKSRHFFFSALYFTIKCGSLISTFLTPFLRADVKCFGKKTCFPLAFFVPAVVNVIGLILFLMGSALYVKKPAEGSVILSVIQCVHYALQKRSMSNDGKKNHWLDYADDRYDTKLIRDIKCFLRILFLYIPLPMFWALTLQKGSRWVLQGTKMNSEVSGYFIKPDHMQALNPLIILFLIPLFDMVIYPYFTKKMLCHTPLQRITVGGLMTAFSFVIAALLERKIETERIDAPTEGQSVVDIVNNSPCFLEIESPIVNNLTSYGKMSFKEPLEKISIWRITPHDCKVENIVETEINFTKSFQITMVTIDSKNLQIHFSNDSHEKQESGDPRIRLMFSIDYEFNDKENASFILRGKETLHIFPDKMFRPGRVGFTEYYSLRPGTYDLLLPINETDHKGEGLRGIKVSPGGSYIVYVLQKASMNISQYQTMVTVSPNRVHLLWQLPQYIVMTAGEVMFSVTGLEFSYSQAPPSLKSLVQAVWLLTTAIGNLIIILLNLLVFEKESNEYFAHAGLMTLSMVIFGVSACFYRYARLDDKS
ncbi:solute carrier family 15 member 2 [Nephila pilipes]|uniref:Oligopeptide transporter 1 n=1 Tax=Nephila pilipes TaxID=299642 RepID=A0A8X6UDE1_NEPPI|nr:solute carrier family 15 member 2 [Nephila pilipes]